MDEDMDVEIDAMGKVSKALSGLDEEVRRRVIRWAAERFDVSTGHTPRNGGPSSPNRDAGGDESEHESTDERLQEAPSGWEHFAELYDAAGATTHPEGMLVAAYWVQVVLGKGSFGSFELNKLLKDLGHGVTGTAKVMTNLITRKPALVLQLKKSGKTQQARKTYRVTEAGKKAVEQMIANGG